MKPYSWLRIAVMLLLIAGAGCSKREVPPPPKTQPELLLEIYDSARKQQYNATLLKLQKMRALEPTSVFLAELENTIRFNQLTLKVNHFLQMGRFEDALIILQDYEKRHGYSDATAQAKERLFLIVRMDRLVRSIKESRRSDQLEGKIKELKILAKNIKLSPKIENFLQKKESVIPDLRKVEAELTNREILAETEERFKAGDYRSSGVLAAIYALTVPKHEERIFSLLSGPDPVKKAKKQPIPIERKKE